MPMNIITLNIYNDSAKNEILEFLKKFKPQEAEIRLKVETVSHTENKVTEHPFFGMINNYQETIEDTMSRLRGSRY